MARLADTLARAVLPLFGRLGLSQETLLTGPLLHTNLSWQVPPLVNESKLEGMPLWEYFDVALSVDEDALCLFWQETMTLMRNQPYKVFTMKGYRGASRVLHASTGERLYWLSRPEGYPSNITEYAGAIFSMECAHVLKLAGHAAKVVETDDDYYVVTHKGYKVGVEDGLPLVGAVDWDLSIKGMVYDLLRQPRGDVFTGCDYDLISKLRSVLWEHKDSIPEFEAADLVFQALRVLAQGANLKPLQSGMQNLREAAATDDRRLKVFKEAIELVKVPGLSDRQKIKTLRDVLVPAALNKTTFTRVIYPYHREAPAMLRKEQMEKMLENLVALHDVEKLKHANKA